MAPGAGPDRTGRGRGHGSYGAGLARRLRAAGVRVVEVDRPNRQARYRHGKSDPVGTIEAARAADERQSGRSGQVRDGHVEAFIRVAGRSAQCPHLQDQGPDPDPPPGVLWAR